METGIDFEEQLDKLARVSKRVRHAVIAGVLLVIGAGYSLTAYQEDQAELERLEQESHQLQRKLNNVRSIASNLVAFEQEVATLERSLESALRQLPNRKQFEDLLRDISTAGKKVGIEIKSLRRRPEEPRGFYAEVPFEISLEGEYHDIAKFFERVSSLSRIVNIGALDFTATRERAGNVALKVDGTATTFRFLTEAEQSAATPDRKGKAKGRA